MTSIAIAEGLYRLTLFAIGILLARAGLMFFDTHFANSSFQRWLEKANDEARALYLGLRMLGICIAVGLVLG